MATFLDVTLVQQASPVFVAVFVFAVVFALLQTLKIPGEDKNLHAIIALMMALFSVFLKPVRDMVLGISPWFVLLFIFIMFMLIAIKMLGVDDSTIGEAVKSDSGRFIIYIVVAIGVVILAFNLSLQFGQNIGPFLGGDNATGIPAAGVGGSTNTGDFNQNLAATLFHPKVLGMVLVFAIGSFTIRFLAKPN
jgi:hypothetical protein